MISIVTEPIDSDAVLRSVTSAECGATVLFVGTTRQFTGEKETVTLAYECHQPMAIAKLTQLRDRASEQWPVQQCSIVHRVGTVGIGESSIVIAVASPHRKDAYAASQWLMDRIKEEVPIWKKEHFADGNNHWVHEGVHPSATQSDATDSTATVPETPHE